MVQNTADYLLQRACDDDVAILAGARPADAVTYGQLKLLAAQSMAALSEAGVRPGDVVALMAANSASWIAAYLAALKARAIIAPLPITLPDAEARAQLARLSCRACFVDRRVHGRLSQAPGPAVPLIMVESLAGRAGARWPTLPMEEDDSRDAAYMLTSGSTAEPRVVRISHANIQANTDSILAYLGLGRQDRMLVVLPFHYCFGLSLVHTHLRAGGSLALSNTFAFPETTLDMLEQTECTGLAGVPSTYHMLLRSSTFARRNLRHLKHMQQAGGKLVEPLIRELIAAAPRAALFVMYGQTEATARLSYLPPEHLADKLGSIGAGIPGVSLRVIAADGRDVAPGEVGEIVARGRNISAGYLDDANATCEKFRAGALHTGDLATIDAEGFIYIVDRVSDFIKPHGHRVSSQQIEACLFELPEITAAAAVGVPDDASGEAIRAFISLRPGAALSPDAIIRHCARRLPRYMVPREALVLEQLPTNANGKVARAALRAWHAAGEPATAGA